MATTDAISVACKQLGIGADVYMGYSDSKNAGRRPPPPQGDAVEEWANTWMERIKKANIQDDGTRARLEKLVEDTRKSRDQERSKKAMDEIKKAINGN